MAIGKLILMALVVDFVYQLVVFRRLYPVEAIDVAFLLAVVPYFVIRGPINRLGSLWIRRGKR